MTRTQQGWKEREEKKQKRKERRNHDSQHEQQEGPRPPVYVFLLQGPAVLCEGFVWLLPDLLKLILLHSLKEPVHVLLARLQLHPLER